MKKPIPDDTAAPQAPPRRTIALKTKTVVEVDLHIALDTDDLAVYSSFGSESVTFEQNIEGTHEAVIVSDENIHALIDGLTRYAQAKGL